MFITNEVKQKNEIEIENRNVIKKDYNTLSFVFSETVERYFPDLSNAEIYQVRINFIFYFLLIEFIIDLFTSLFIC